MLFKFAEQAYLASAESREKRIAELEMTVGTLRNFSNEQATCIEELEAQIEKLKCLLNEIYSEYGFSELVRIRNNLPIEIQEVIKEMKGDERR